MKAGRLRQAIDYERRLSVAEVQAHRELVDAQLRAERDLRQMADAAERKYTDGQYGQVNILAQEHRTFHEREHLLYEDAIAKAAGSLRAELSALSTDVDRVREAIPLLMTVDRFEREHAQLTEKLEASIAALGVKLGAEERVTVRQAAQEELLVRIQQNNRWLAGILVTVAIFGITTVLHVFGVL